MPTDMGVTNSKFVKSNRKPKKTKHFTIPKNIDKRRRTKKSSRKGIGLINMKVQSKRHKSQDDAQKPNLRDRVNKVHISRKEREEKGRLLSRSE